MAVKVDFNHQDNIIRHYVCANCWGELSKRFTGERTTTGAFIFDIDCETEGCPCHGFVSRHFIEKAEVIARMERYDAWRDLKDILGWVREKGPYQETEGRWNPETETTIPKQHRKNSEILSELGF